jgi:PhoPQ-activated pathogenicity-related protein
MPKTAIPLRLVLFLCFALFGCSESGQTPPAPHPVEGFPTTALDRYVHEADASYRWRVARSGGIENITVQVVELISQTWRPQGEVSPTQWRHWLVICKPDELRSDTALLFIDGGRHNSPRPDAPEERLARIAQRTGAITVQLTAVPNQPLVFDSDGVPRTEDDLIAYTWARYLDDGTPEWLAQLPMVKSAVRAMDAVQQLHGIERFVVTGASKRGWTTWLTGAVDTRVVAMMPMVIDVLNVLPSMDHHFAAYGFWAPALKDYVHHNITERRHTPRFAELLKQVDPYSYRERFTQPKFLVNATGDEFFLPDSARFYIDDLPGETYLRYVPNTRHKLRSSDALDSLEAYFHAFVDGRPRPRFDWEFQERSILLTVLDKPAKVALWQASNPGARDFRLDTIGPVWRETVLSPDDSGSTYLGEVERPDFGWTAFFLELTYDSHGEFPLKFTTPVSVVPERTPFAQEARP